MGCTRQDTRQSSRPARTHLVVPTTLARAVRLAFDGPKRPEPPLSHCSVSSGSSSSSANSTGSTCSEFSVLSCASNFPNYAPSIIASCDTSLTNVDSDCDGAPLALSMMMLLMMMIMVSLQTITTQPPKNRTTGTPIDSQSLGAGT